LIEKNNRIVTERLEFECLKPSSDENARKTFQSYFFQEDTNKKRKRTNIFTDTFEDILKQKLNVLWDLATTQ